MILLNVHTMLAGITKTDELALDPAEAHNLAEATAKVGRHYNMAMSAQAIDWTNLFMTIGAVYGPRVMAIRIRRMAARPAAQPRAAATPRPAPESAAPSNGTRTTFIPGVGHVEVPSDA